MSRKYLAKPNLFANVKTKLNFVVVYHKYITDNHFHIQCMIRDKPYFFVVQVHKDTIDIYDAKNDFLHTFSKKHPSFAIWKNPLNLPRINLDAVVSILTDEKDLFSNHHPGIHSLTTPDGEQNIVYQKVA